MRLVILTFESYEANLITQHVLAAYPDGVVGVVAARTPLVRTAGVGFTRYVRRQFGLFGLWKGTAVALSRTAVLLRRLGIGHSPPGIGGIARQSDVPIAFHNDVNASVCVSTIRSWRPDLLVSVNLHQRIGSELLALPTHGSINVHGSLLPRHRGLFPYFWALAHNDAQSGATVHWMDEHLDTGDIILQDSYPVERGDTALDLALRSARMGSRLLVEGIAGIEAGSAHRVPQDLAAGTYASWPERRDMRAFRKHGHRLGSLSKVWAAIARSEDESA